ncbi:hypothetical protein TCAL_02153 [Tigriopus californicus]|uniref:OCIA domain-containing protein n=2 Tax=Tigriopus californicus TaxID=6832 RepID=A0A553N7R5_TIGCA|nr:hypothetical protein TCAL_02153 [Tigriopus californicus]|eukprot:TCALIF_02153-PA protein Name:"Similar to asrij OCIA domain-containing protein 1 (Drosophila melanogaster)" AED:0.17 eAED:0.17 QI:0/-1/0/1/-1/1/1/0/155
MNRGLPGGAVGAALAVMAVKSGRLTPHPTYGAIPKAVGMGLLGFFSGRFSYANVCVDRVLHQAPESVLAQRIRKQRGITSPYDDETAPGSLGGSSMAPEGSGYPSSRSDFPSSRASPALSNLPASVPSALPESDPNYAPPSKMRRKNKYGDDVFD